MKKKLLSILIIGSFNKFDFSFISIKFTIIFYFLEVKMNSTFYKKIHNPF